MAVAFVAVTPGYLGKCLGLQGHGLVCGGEAAHVKVLELAARLCLSGRALHALCALMRDLFDDVVLCQEVKACWRELDTDGLREIGKNFLVSGALAHFFLILFLGQ